MNNATETANKMLCGQNFPLKKTISLKKGLVETRLKAFVIQSLVKREIQEKQLC